MYRLNVRFLCWLLVGVLVCVSSVHAVHSFRTNTQAQAFLREARRARNAGQAKSALAFFRRYTLISPDDIDGLAEYGELLAETGSWHNAYLSLNRVLAADPSRLAVRRKVAELGIGLERYSDSRRHLESVLLKQFPDDVVLWGQLGMCLAQLGEQELASDAFETAITKAPSEVDRYKQLADYWYYECDRKDEAIALLDTMVSRNPEDYRAFVCRGLWNLNRATATSGSGSGSELANVLVPGDTTQPTPSGSLDLASSDVAAALALSPNEADPLLLAAEIAIRRNQFEEAKAFALRCQRSDPSTPGGYSAAAKADLGLRDVAGAVRSLKTGIDKIPENSTLRWNLANLLIEQGELEPAARELVALQQLQIAPEPVRYLQSRLLASKGEWLAAIRELESIRTNLRKWPGLSKKVDFWLGKYYESLGRPDQQLEAYRRAVAADPSSIETRSTFADALAAAGRSDEAVVEYRRITSSNSLPAATAVSYVRLLIRDGLKKVGQADRFEAAEQTLEQLASADSGSSHLAILKAELHLAQGNQDDAENSITDARLSNPDDLDLWSAQATLAIRAKNWEQADQLFAEARKRFPGASPPILIEAHYIAQRFGLEAGTGLRELAGRISAVDERARVELVERVAAVAFGVQALPLARELGKSVAESQADNIAVRLLLLEVAHREKDKVASQRILDEIRRIDGEGAIWHYGEAARLSLFEVDSDSKAYLRAQEHLLKAQAERPSWSRVPALSGFLYEQEGNLDLAADRYREAIASGERDSLLVKQLINILFRLRRYGEVETLVRLLNSRQGEAEVELTLAAAKAALQLGHHDRALQLAQDVARASGRYQDRIWLAQVQMTLGDLGAAEQEIKRAIEMAPTSPEPRVVFVELLHRLGRIEEAKVAVQHASKAIAPEVVALTEARCYEILKDNPLAVNKYKAAVEQSPGDAEIRLKMAIFLLRVGQHVEASTHFEKILDMGGNNGITSTARRNLAIALSMTGQPRQIERGLKLLDENLRNSPTKSTADMQAKAGILASQPLRHQQILAIEILEGLPSYDRHPKNELVLGQLYLAVGNWDKGRKQLRRVALENGNDVPSLVTYVGALLAQGEDTEAEVWLAKLRQIAPYDSRTIGLTARTFAKKGDVESAIRSLRDVISQVPSTLQLPTEQVNRTKLSIWVAGQMESLVNELPKGRSEELAAKLISTCDALISELDLKDLEDRLAVAAFKARQGDARLVCEIIASERQSLSSSQIGDAIRSCLNRKTKEDELAKLNLTITEVVKTGRPDPDLCLAIADFALWKGDYRMAQGYYLRVLGGAPNDLRALNNYALSIASVPPPSKDALAVVEKAIELHGERAELLDTRGLIHMELGDLPAAVADFERSFQEKPSAETCLHLSAAQLSAGMTKKAKASFTQSQSLGLDKYKLHPTDLKWLDRLHSLN